MLSDENFPFVRSCSMIQQINLIDEPNSVTLIKTIFVLLVALQRQYSNELLIQLHLIAFTECDGSYPVKLCYILLISRVLFWTTEQLETFI